MTRLTQSQQALQYELRDLLKTLPQQYKLNWVKIGLFDTTSPEELEPWFESGASQAANERHAKRMDQYNSTDIAMMRGR